MAQGFPRIVGVKSEPMPHSFAQEEVRECALAWFRPHAPELERLADVFAHAEISHRDFCVPLHWFQEPHDLEEKSRLFEEIATSLSSRAITELLAAHDVAAAEVRHIVFVTSTGLATPTIDARLLNLLDLSKDINRIPLFGLGCAGGTLGLSIATDILEGAPSDLLLLLNVELCTPTFHFHDFSKSNLIATALFSDGITAALLAGAEHDLRGAEILAKACRTWPDSLDAMGWNFLSDGMQVIFSKRIPDMVSAHMRAYMEQFLHPLGLDIDSLPHLIVHPGGPAVLRAYEEALDLKVERLALSRAVLRAHGNCSATTVMLMLEELLHSGRAQRGELGLMSALGPGFTAASILLRF